MAAVNRPNTLASNVRGFGTISLTVGTLMMVASCAQPVKGFREDPGACSVVSDPSVVKQLGEEAFDVPATADVSHTDSQQSSKCEWTSIHPPGWGTPAEARLSVTVRVELTEDGEPNPAGAQYSYQTNKVDKGITDAPPNVIGELSSRWIQQGTRDHTQVITIDFVRANAHVTVEYRGWGNEGLKPHFIPLEAQQGATLDFAHQAAAALGEPR